MDWKWDLKLEFQSYVFEVLTTSAIKFEFAQYIVMSYVLMTVMDEYHERCLFPILPVNVLWS